MLSAPGYYGITASLDGFRTARFERVEILLGQIRRLDFTLLIGSVQQVVSLSAASLLVDVRQSAVLSGRFTPVQSYLPASPERL